MSLITTEKALGRSMKVTDTDYKKYLKLKKRGGLTAGDYFASANKFIEAELVKLGK